MPPYRKEVKSMNDEDILKLETNFQLDKSILELCREACVLLTEVQQNFVDKTDRVAEQQIRNARMSIQEFRDWGEKVLETARSKFIV